MAVEITTDQAKFAALKKQLKGSPASMNRELNKALKAAAKPIEDAEKAAALALPAKGHSSTGFRRNIAAATKTRISTSKSNPGVRVYVNYKSMPNGQGSAARGTARTRGWRHPVYGHAVWVKQVMKPGWWLATARPQAAQAQQKIRAAMDATAKKIANK